MKEKLFTYIHKKTPLLKEVLSFRLKDTDDDYGFAGEHYIVNCLIKQPNLSIPQYNLLDEKEATCLVNVLVFNNWLKQENSIKWV